MTAFKEKISTVKGKIHLVIWSVFWVLTCLLFFLNTQAVIGEKDDRPFWAWIVYFALIAVIIFSIVYCVRKWLYSKSEVNEKGKHVPGKFTWKHEIAFAATAVFTFFIVEMINNADMLLQMFIVYALMNILGAFIMLNILMGWLNSFRRTILIFTIFATVMALVFYFVYLFRGEPFQFIDIFAAGTAADVMGGYTFKLSRWAVVMCTAALCFIAIIMHGRDYKWAFSIKARILTRAGVFGFMIAAFFMYTKLGWNTALGITADLWAPHKTYQEVGTNMGFFCIAKFMRNEPPAGYSVAEVERVESEFEEEFEPVKEEYTLKVDQKPVNIIAIMNEAWADYGVFEKFSSSEDYMPFYNSMDENTVKGHALVCITGGGTAKTEYEFLTGNSVKQYPGMVPYVSYYTHDQYSMVTTLEANGYESAAMHPNKATNWNRDRAYDYLNFDRFYTIDDFDENCEKIRNMVSDKANYEKIIEVIENKKDPSQPFFLFDVTMQNHGGYETDNYPVSVKAQGYNDDAWNRYLSLVRESDDALKYLIEYFEDYDEPTMICVFGDHLPGMDQGVEKYLSGKERDDLDIDEYQKHYQTPFLIWANYDIEEQTDVLTSTNFLGTLMLQQAGVKLTPFNNYELKLMDDIAAYNHKGYVNDEGENVLWNDAPEEIKQKILEFEYLQYNTLVEDSRRTDRFFTVGEDDQ